MQKTFLLNTENETGYQPDKFGRQRVEGWRFRSRFEMRAECTCRYRQGSCLGPNRQTTTPENAAGFQVLFSSVLLDDSSAECFVCFDGSLGNG